MVRGARWQSFWFGLFGVLLGGMMVYQVVTRTPHPVTWPVTAVAKKLDPSVVVVLNNQRSGSGEKTRGMGSGVIIDRQGDIVTNYHVVAGAQSVWVVLADGMRYKARIIGEDPATDLAVIHIKATHLVPVTFAPSHKIEPGELVVAIGNSLGLTHTVTAGVISAKDRVMYRDGWEYHLIQTDAAINPGNSGGPLVNTYGQMIGINSSKISQAGIEGIGFAIPSTTVRYVVNQILHFGHVRRPWIGALLQPGGPSAPGLLVVGVTPNGPAARAGIHPGDWVTEINGTKVRSVHDVIRVLETTEPGRTVTIQLLRGPQPLKLLLQLGELPSTPQEKSVS